MGHSWGNLFHFPRIHDFHNFHTSVKFVVKNDHPTNQLARVSPDSVAPESSELRRKQEIHTSDIEREMLTGWHRVGTRSTGNVVSTPSSSASLTAAGAPPLSSRILPRIRPRSRLVARSLPRVCPRILRRIPPWILRRIPSLVGRVARMLPRITPRRSRAAGILHRTAGTEPGVVGTIWVFCIPSSSSAGGSSSFSSSIFLHLILGSSWRRTFRKFFRCMCFSLQVVDWWEGKEKRRSGFIGVGNGGTYFSTSLFQIWNLCFCRKKEILEFV